MASSASDNDQDRGKHRRSRSRDDHSSSDSRERKRRRRDGDENDERSRLKSRHEDDRSDDDSQSSSDDRRREKKRSKKHHKRKHHHKSPSSSKRRRGSDDSHSGSDIRSDSYSDSDSDSYDSRRSDRKEKKRKHKSKKEKKKKKHKKHKKHHKHDKKSKNKQDDKNSSDKEESSVPVFGKYGILKASDFSKKQRSFEVWMAEVKGMPEFNGPKWEKQNYFDEYREDYNTVTLPHKKYYDYETWEMQEYKKRQEEQQRDMADLEGRGNAKADEARHQLEIRKRAQQRQVQERNMALSMMNKDKVKEMKRQAELKAELQVAFKTGDQEKIKRLKAKLEPDER